MWTMNFQMSKLDLEKSVEPETKLPTSIGSLKKQESSRKVSTSALLTMPNDCVEHNKLWKILKEIGTPDHLICLLRNPYAGQEAATRHGIMDWFQIGKGVHQGCILSTCLLTNMQSISCELLPGGKTARIKINGRTINNSDMQITPPSWQKLKIN